MRGIFPALVTPMSADGQVNVEAVEALIAYHLNARVNGFYVCGNTGEGLLLEQKTRIQMAKCVCEHVAGRARVIVHVGATVVEEARTLARAAASAGADAISSLPPTIFHPKFEAIFAYYQTLTQESDLPLYLYHIPELTGASFSLDEFGQLFTIPQVVGIKFSDYNLFLMQQIRTRFPNITVFSGFDEVFLPALLMGAHGAIGATFNYMPSLFVGIYQAWTAGHLEYARELQFRANQVIAQMLDYGYIPASKSILRMKGYKCGTVSPPLHPLTAEAEIELHRKLKQIGFFSEHFAPP